MTTFFNLAVEPQGLLLFRCQNNGKAPKILGGYKGATKNFDIAGTLASGDNLGFPMSLNYLVGIDMDVDATKGYNGIETIKNLEQELGELPPTYTQITPRKGQHKVYFARTLMRPIGKIGKDVDIKWNGYLLFAGSSINGNYYKAINGVAVDGKLVFSELPQKWIEYLEKRPSYQANSTSKEAKPSKIYTEIDTDRMFNNCKFLSYCSIEENASCLPEPMWHSMIQVLSCIEDSDSLIHTLSEPYHSYSYKETQKKIDNARKFGQPHSCDYISANFPEICKNCPSAINERLV